MFNDKLKILKILSVVGGILILDRFLKMFVQIKLAGLALVPHLLQLKFYANDKGPFSLPIPNLATIIVSSVLIIILLILILKPPQFILRARSAATSREAGEFSTSRSLSRCISGFRLNNIRLALISITAGAASNLFDRIFYGYTIDTFQFLNFSFFNLADGLIFAGVILLILKLGVLPSGGD